MPVRILIVDDHEVVRAGARTILAAARPEWELAEAEDGLAAIEALAEGKSPDLIVMDITMPRVSGLVAASRIRALGFTRPILIFTMHKSSLLENEVRQAGAQGYVLKSQAVDDLVRAIDTLLRGGTFFGSGADAGDREPKVRRRGASFCISIVPKLV